MLQHSPRRRPRLQNDKFPPGQPVSSAASGTKPTATQANVESTSGQARPSTPPMHTQPASIDQNKTTTYSKANSGQQTPPVSRPPASQAILMTSSQQTPPVSRPPASQAILMTSSQQTPPVSRPPASQAILMTSSQQTPPVSRPPASQAISMTPSQPPMKTTSSAGISEMQKQIAFLQRQLEDTQAKLSKSNSQCQELHAAITRKDQVSDHNLTHSAIETTPSAIDKLPPTTTTISPYRHTAVSQPTNTLTTFSPCRHTAVSQPTNTSTTYTAAMSSMHTDSIAYSVAMPSTQAAPPLSLPMFVNSVNMPPTQTMPALINAYESPATNNLTPPFWGLNQQPPTASSLSNYAMSMPRKLQDLPDFSGEPEDWPLFYTAFIQSTTAYGYTNLENNQRLYKCLKGEAREVVKSLLIHPDNVDAIIEQLKFRFGRPEQLIHSQIRIVRESPHVSENNLVKLIPFSTKVKNLAVFLQSVNGQQHIANPTLLEELIAKLPMSKKLEWARVAATIQPYPTIIDFSNWISEVAKLICSVQEVEQRDQKRRVLLHTTEKQQQQCPVCQGVHKIFDCSRFLNMNIQERWKQIKKIRACFSCLNTGHVTRDCRRKKPCSKDGCQRKHNKLLHEDTPSDAAFVQPNPVNEPQQKVLSCSAGKNKLLFRVLPVTLYGENCKMDIYALFDDGSSITMLDREVADTIGVRGKNCPLNIQWFGGRSARESAISFNVKVSGINKSSCHLLKNVYAVSNLNLPMQSLTQNDIDIGFKNLPLSPVKPYTNVVPKLLIGLDHASLGLPSITNSNNLTGPFVCNTELGWVVYGPCHNLSSIQQSCLFVSAKENDDLHQMVADYFNIESLGVRSAPIVESNDDVRAKKILHETTKRVGKRFQTGLLWKHDDVRFPNNYPMALSRFEGIDRKLKRDPELSSAYKEVLRGYIDKGYIRKVCSEDTKATSVRKWYLPHFGVTNPNKPNKLRLVFDAAASIDGISLNSQLLKGPQHIASLPSTLFNFRRGQIAVGGDIREMFHQILVQPCDRISQRFLWKDDDAKTLPQEYEMLVMTFGATCSPCSASYVMKKNARDHEEHHPRAVKAICDHHYVDDFIDSFDSEEEAISISKKVREIHEDGGFELRGFISNSEKVTLAMDGTLKSKHIPGNEGTEKVLGLYWEPSSDHFIFNLKFNRVDQFVMSGHRSPTKRQVLSIIMSTFDPLGYLSHFTVGGKLLLREIWRNDCRWDEPIPNVLNNAWERWRSQINNICDFKVPRFYFSSGKPTCLQLHIFVDASEEAFAAVAYWRYSSNNGSISTSFITSKTKCAPLKRVSVPRLELQAAVLGTRLKQNILSEHNLVPDKCTLWGDSKTVLKWIASSHRRYKPYVAHRIAEILESTEIENWRWVSTKDNVADEATRAYNNIDFTSSSRRLNGPSFLKLPEEEWTATNSNASSDEDEEEIRPQTSLLIVNETLIEFNRFSSLFRIKRTIAWVLRFINRCRKRYDDLQGYGLTSCEIENAEKILCLQVQRELFSAELKLVKNGQPVSKNSNLYNLMPYIDDDGLLRVYGRIDAASYLPYSSRRPIILPKDHSFTKLVVMHHHRRMRHQNHEATIYEVRKKYWIPQVRSVLKNIVSNCLHCKIKNANPRAPVMGPLPFDRLEPNIETFKYTGLDYFGPFNVSIGRRTEKRWVALFTCLTVRAIHLELAHDLSTDSCIIAMRNFMNRRGIPSRIRSDNGKNFIGADEEAKRFSEVFDAEKIQAELSTNGIEWVFNCPANPSAGGIWERMVQCVKRVLRHTLKEVSPKEHVLQSLLIEAENIVNSRPLTHLPISPNEEEPLTPNDFLIGRRNVANTPSVETPDLRLLTLKKQWRVARCLRDRLWKRWISEYLPTLTRRVKWCERTTPMKEGDLVFICDPNIPRSQWRRGMVTCVYSGPDGVARRAEVKTASGKLLRPVSKLAVLDLESSEASRSTGVGMLQNALS